MSENQLVVAQNQNQVTVQDERISEETLVSYMDAFGIASQLSEQGKKQFIEIAKAFNLNPFKREIYAVPYAGKAQILTGYEVYIRRAERSGLLAGWSVDYDPKDKSATCTIHRKDWAQPFINKVYMMEYQQKSPIWTQKPITMIKKVAISHAFRLCFPSEVGGLPYTSDEMPDYEYENKLNEGKIEKIQKEQERKEKVEARKELNAAKTETTVKALADAPLYAKKDDVMFAVARIKNELDLHGEQAGTFFKKVIKTKEMSKITIEELANLHAAIDVELYEKKAAALEAEKKASETETVVNPDVDNTKDQASDELPF